MSTTTTLTENDKPALSLTLGNGNKIYYHSDEAVDIEGEIPIIDIAGIYSDNIDDRKAVAEQIREAAHRIGFFYIVNHGVDQKYADQTFAAAREFFDLPMKEKMEVCTDRVPDEFVGYFPMAAYNRSNKKEKDLMEAYNWGYNPKYDPEVPSAEEPNTISNTDLWPNSLPGWKDTLYSHHTQLLTLARQLTHTFALALYLPESHFDPYVRHPTATMRITHYPPQTLPPADQLGIGAHTDFECFTLLTQDPTSGLEVLSKSGYWVKANPVPGSIVVNIADCLMRMTNGYFESTVHRVVNQGDGEGGGQSKERYSCPFFFGFDHDMRLETVPGCVSEGNPNKYDVMTSREYLKFRMKQSKGTAKAAV